MSTRNSALLRVLRGKNFTRLRSIFSVGWLTIFSLHRSWTWGAHSNSSFDSVAFQRLHTTGVTSRLSTFRNRNIWQRISSLMACSNPTESKFMSHLLGLVSASVRDYWDQNWEDEDVLKVWQFIFGNQHTVYCIHTVLYVNVRMPIRTCTFTSSTRLHTG